MKTDHVYRRDFRGGAVCTKCGAAKHTQEFEGFKYWYAGKGLDQEMPCPRAGKDDFIGSNF